MPECAPLECSTYKVTITIKGKEGVKCQKVG